MNKSFIGKIVGGDIDYKEVTIGNVSEISGVHLGTNVLVIPIDSFNVSSNSSEYDILKWRLEELEKNKNKQIEEDYK